MLEFIYKFLIPLVGNKCKEVFKTAQEAVVGKPDQVSLEEGEESSPRRAASFVCSKCSCGRNTGITEWERPELIRLHRAPPGRKWAPRHVRTTSVLSSAASTFCSSVFCSLRLLLKEQNLVRHDGKQGPALL